jgi:hypothetical protein
MEKGSPLWAGAPEKHPLDLDFGNKKHTMGNKFNKPNFTPLFQIIKYLVDKNVGPLQPNDLLCVSS